ncbi:DUF3626 domain-containing protein [Shewanella khirikhana]|uniref:DUF3626 domain-containing protein n=1 Tax=Shewanella khirikhana TaxID=1965282 RepID=A0ABM7DPN9_9GAMM|nr:DUF3626 domain-containing protein [Shewanella khirikhana]AZQ11641.1 hypothetical protein STH12_02572 [Shewanella khirikhana]
MPTARARHFAAIDNLSHYARSRRDGALAIIRNVLQMSDISPARFNAAMQAIASHGQVALHFHPDRFDSRGLMVAEGLAQDGRYRCQFETRVSSGLLSPEIGGARDHWERSFFGEVSNELTARPKYGALDLLRAPNGPAPRFGSCYLLTKPEVLERATFCFHDSYRNPCDKGTAEAFELVMAALLTESFERRYALGEYGLSPGKLIERLLITLNEDAQHRFMRPLAGNLDHYIEAQIHGPVLLGNDIDALVADPSFRGTEIEPLLNALASRYDINLMWHRGLSLAVEDVVSDFRGPSMPTLARRVAIDGQINAYAIGVAAREVSRFPTRWRDRGHQADVLSELKWLWHLLVRYGSTTDCCAPEPDGYGADIDLAPELEAGGESGAGESRVVGSRVGDTAEPQAVTDTRAMADEAACLKAEPSKPDSKDAPGSKPSTAD